MESHKKKTLTFLIYSWPTVLLIYFLLYQFADLPTLLYLQHALSAYPKAIKAMHLFGLFSDPKLWAALTLLSIGLWALQKKLKLQKKNEGAFLQWWSCSFLLSLTLGTLLKTTIGRLRPQAYLQYHDYGFSLLNFHHIAHSTPSGHALCIFTALPILCTYFKKWMPLFWIIALSVCISRLLAFQHYPSDLLAGAALGYSCALICRPKQLAE